MLLRTNTDIFSYYKRDFYFVLNDPLNEQFNVGFNYELILNNRKYNHDSRSKRDF